MNSLVLLLPLVIGLTWIRLIRPGFNHLQGTPILTFRLPLLARIRMHAIPATVALGLAVFLAVDGSLPWWTIAFPIVSNVLLLALPVRYTVTAVGIRLGWTRFRRWTEFAAVRRAPGGARLVGVHKARGMHIWLSRSRGDDEFLQFLRHTMRNAYKGDSTVVPFPGQHGGVTGGDDFHQPQISAYTTER
jgi:hypothetical protein